MGDKKKRLVKKQTATARLSPVALVFTLGGGALIAALAGACLLWVVADPGHRLAADGASSATAGAGLRYLWVSGALLAMVLAVIVQWRLLRRATVTARIPAPDPAKTPGPSPPAAALLREQRVFVYLLSRLQREGRLMDFLAENLDAYEDGQIGAAVRSVHAGCRQVVEKLLAPKPAMDQAEASQVTLGADYDPHLVTLTGRVGDHPPFQGVVRHTGWRASRIDIPLLADETDPTIIAPAEVEIR